MRRIERHLNKRIQRKKRLMARSQRKLFQMKVMVMVQVKRIQIRVAMFEVNYKKQLQIKLIVKVHFNRMQRTILGLLERNLKKLLRMKVKGL